MRIDHARTAKEQNREYSRIEQMHSQIKMLIELVITKESITVPNTICVLHQSWDEESLEEWYSLYQITCLYLNSTLPTDNAWHTQFKLTVVTKVCVEQFDYQRIFHCQISQQLILNPPRCIHLTKR